MKDVLLFNVFKKSLSNTYTQNTTLELTYVNGSLLFTYEFVADGS